jgi:hypothetical protein
LADTDPQRPPETGMQLASVPPPIRSGRPKRACGSRPYPPPIRWTMARCRPCA